MKLTAEHIELRDDEACPGCAVKGIYRGEWFTATGPNRVVRVLWFCCSPSNHCDWMMELLCPAAFYYDEAA